MYPTILRFPELIRFFQTICSDQRCLVIAWLPLYIIEWLYFGRRSGISKEMDISRQLTYRPTIPYKNLHLWFQNHINVVTVNWFGWPTYRSGKSAQKKSQLCGSTVNICTFLRMFWIFRRNKKWPSDIIPSQRWYASLKLITARRLKKISALYDNFQGIFTFTDIPDFLEDNKVTAIGCHMISQYYPRIHNFRFLLNCQVCKTPFSKIKLSRRASWSIFSPTWPRRTTE